eukprot:m.1049402 g.1049402  ORF g.1049402 m.1049402 type:complete len:381 (+) comp24173_c2_seq1:141-1283(+)
MLPSPKSPMRSHALAETPWGVPMEPCIGVPDLGDGFMDTMVGCTIDGDWINPVGTTFDPSSFGEGGVVHIEGHDEDMKELVGSSFSNAPTKLDQEILSWHDHLSACLSAPEHDGAHAADISRRENPPAHAACDGAVMGEDYVYSASPPQMTKSSTSSDVSPRMLNVPFNGLPVSPAGSNGCESGGMIRHRSEPISQSSDVDMALSPLTPPGSDGSGVSPANSCDDVTKPHNTRKSRFQKLNRMFRPRSRSISVDASLSASMNAIAVHSDSEHTRPRERSNSIGSTGSRRAGKGIRRAHSRGQRRSDPYQHTSFENQLARNFATDVPPRGLTFDASCSSGVPSTTSTAVAGPVFKCTFTGCQMKLPLSLLPAHIAAHKNEM